MLVEADGASVRLRTSEVEDWVLEDALEETVEEVDSLTEALDDTEDDEEGSADT